MNTRSILIGIGILAILTAVTIQVRTDYAANANGGSAGVRQPTSLPAQLAAVKPASENKGLFFVPPESDRGEVILYDAATALPRVKLPVAGKLSADQKHYSFAQTDEARNTLVEIYDVESGLTKKHATLAGEWTVSGISASARWIALMNKADDPSSISHRNGKTQIDILDANVDAIVHQFTLNGDYDVDALSEDGGSLFLIQHLPAASINSYEIRLYDLVTETLLPDVLREKGADEVMEGQPYQQVATLDGSKLLTVFVDSNRHVAFIHDLDLVNKSPWCIDLPSGTGDINTLKNYSIALSPDGKEAYAINVGLGLIVRINIEDNTIEKEADFGGYPPPKGTLESAGQSVSPSIVSKDGKRVFFADKKEIWAFDALSGRVTDGYQLGTIVHALGVNESGTRLYAVASAEAARVFMVPINGTLVPLE